MVLPGIGGQRAENRCVARGRNEASAQVRYALLCSKMGSFGKKVFFGDEMGLAKGVATRVGGRLVVVGGGRQPQHARARVLPGNWARTRPETEVHGVATGGWAGTDCHLHIVFGG